MGREGGRGASGPPRGCGGSAAPGRRAGRQVSGAAPRCPQRAVAPPLAAAGRSGEKDERPAAPRGAIAPGTLPACGAPTAPRVGSVGAGRIRQAIIQQTAPSGDLAGASICNYPAKYRVNLVLERGPLQLGGGGKPAEHLRRAPRRVPCPTPPPPPRSPAPPPQPDRLRPTQ